MLRIYYGLGEGKTSTAFGLVCRAAGHGKRACVLQFMQGFPSGEYQAATKLLPGQVDVLLLGRPVALERFPASREESLEVYREHFVRGRDPSSTDRDLVRDGIKKARELLGEGSHDLVVLDEVLTALEFKIIGVPEILDLVRINMAELVLTGRAIAPELLEAADYATEYGYVKHPFEQGVLAREAYDY
jgi:cob(I)alamin adenosyltransferase